MPKPKTKTCTECGQLLTIDEFYFVSRKR
ncbi:hypothetical protein LCGC14_3146810, partial [marine sediment metagenome]